MMVLSDQRTPARRLLQGKKLRMFRPYMFGYPSRFSVLLICFLIFSLDSEAQGPKSVPAPVAPAKRPSPTEKDRSALPPVPMLKDIAKEVGLVASHIAAPEAHYVIDSTSGGVGL